MFTRTELKDLELMVERYRDGCIEDAKKIFTTESAKRALGREVLKADELLITIRENVRASEIERYEDGIIPDGSTSGPGIDF